MINPCVGRPSAYISSPAGKEVQRQLWPETLDEISKYCVLPPELT